MMNGLSVGDRVIFYVDESVAKHAPYHFKSKTFFAHTKEIMLVCQTFFLKLSGLFNKNLVIFTFCQHKNNSY